MIELYSGTPGSGKSLHVAKIIRERLRMYNCVIIGNFYVNQNTVKKRKGTYIYVDNSRLYPERLIKFAIRYARHKGRRLKEDELYLFIDEAQLLFNSRDWQLIKTSGWVSFYSQHRKLGFYIGLIAQFDRMLDRQIRSLVENEIKHRKVSRAGLFGKLLGFLTGDNLFIYIKIWYPMKQKVYSEFFLGTKKVYDLYDSYGLFQTIEGNKV
jgi:zona occludens toxin|nr:MAG TPA_asm: zonular occludens toxin [Inoviridae sp.]